MNAKQVERITAKIDLSEIATIDAVQVNNKCEYVLIISEDDFKEFIQQHHVTVWPNNPEPLSLAPYHNYLVKNYNKLTRNKENIFVKIYNIPNYELAFGVTDNETINEYFLHTVGLRADYPYNPNTKYIVREADHDELKNYKKVSYDDIQGFMIQALEKYTNCFHYNPDDITEVILIKPGSKITSYIDCDTIRQYIYN